MAMYSEEEKKTDILKTVENSQVDIDTWSPEVSSGSPIRVESYSDQVINGVLAKDHMALGLLVLWTHQ